MMKMDDIMPKLKLSALLVLAVLAVVLILQNTQMVVTRLLFISIGMPLAALLAFTLVVGFAAGVLPRCTSPGVNLNDNNNTGVRHGRQERQEGQGQGSSAGGCQRGEGRNDKSEQAASCRAGRARSVESR